MIIIAGKEMSESHNEILTKVKCWFDVVFLIVMMLL